MFTERRLMGEQQEQQQQTQPDILCQTDTFYQSDKQDKMSIFFYRRIKENKTDWH